MLPSQKKNIFKINKKLSYKNLIILTNGSSFKINSLKYNIKNQLNVQVFNSKKIN